MATGFDQALAGGPVALASMKRLRSLTTSGADIELLAEEGSRRNAATPAPPQARSASPKPRRQRQQKYNFGQMRTATDSLAAVPPNTGQRGRPARPSLDFSDVQRASTQQLAAAGERKGRKCKPGGQFKCPRCPATFTQKKNLLGNEKKGHYREYTILREGMEPFKQRLCIIADQNAINQLTGQGAATRRLGAISAMLQPRHTNNVPGAADPDEMEPTTYDLEMHDDDFGFSPEPGDRAVTGSIHDDFWNNVVKPLLPSRKRHSGALVGTWRLNDGMFHRPPKPTFTGAPVSIPAMCLVPAFVFAPTLSHNRVIVQLFRKDGQAPCPDGGFEHDTIHKGWTCRHT